MELIGDLGRRLNMNLEMLLITSQPPRKQTKEVLLTHRPVSGLGVDSDNEKLE